MHDVHQAVEALGSALGLDNLEFDQNGNLTLAIEDNLLINLRQEDARTIEIWTALTSAADTRDASVLASLLVANHLGEGTGTARLALTPDRNGIVLCERLAVEDLGDDGLQRRLADFIRYAMFWNSPDAFAQASGRQIGRTLSGDEPSFMIRA